METRSSAADRGVSEILAHVGLPSHLEREKALSMLGIMLQSTSEAKASVMAELETGLSGMAREGPWESRLGALRAARVLIDSGHASEEFIDDMISRCLSNLEDQEVRVRWSVGELIRCLCQKNGVAVWDAVGPEIIRSIRANFDRDAAEPSSTLINGNENQGNGDSQKYGSCQGDTARVGNDGNGHVQSSGAPNSVLTELLQQTYRSEPPGVGEMRHGTEGWKCLETSFRAFQHALEGCGDSFRPCLTQELRELIYRGLSHPNRFVREACHFIMGSVCRMIDENEFNNLSRELAGKLGLGLSDNWSQVRYAASVATRSFATRLVSGDPELRDKVLPLIIPHMCLNRYYVAEGVRTYSQETWRIVMGNEGRKWVANSAPRVVNYYIEQSKANNHAVREAACACIAELMCKVEKQSISQHVPILLKALINCFKDASWPVRDAACLACGKCVTAFPEESRVVLDELYSLWFAHLWDNIYSVREDSAVALGDVARTYGAEAITRIVSKLHEMLPMAKEQPTDSRARSGMENTTLFGVAASRKDRANDPTLHTNLTMYSCGSLAPKLRRGGGCVDHGFAREKEPWEATDGAIYMLRELSDVSPDDVAIFLPEMAEIARLTHFAHCLNLQETLWKSLPRIAKNIGKKKFKPYLNEFLDPMFKSLTCGHRLCESAAGYCIAQIRDFIGPGIFEGRLTDDQKSILHINQDIPPPKGPLTPPNNGLTTEGFH